MDSADVIIIGAGPAGIAAAIQIKRYGIEPVLIEQHEIGGLLRNANNIENYPGFIGGITGIELVKRLKEHLVETGVSVSYEKVLDLDFRDSVFYAVTDKRTVRSGIVVIASGTKPKNNFYVPGSETIENRLFHEVYPIHTVKNSTIVIIGAGDAAFDYALNLSKHNKVIILNRGEKTQCLPLLRERSNETETITCYKNTVVRNIQEIDNKIHITCEHTHGMNPDAGIQGETPQLLKADYIIAATGREANLDFLSAGLKKNFENVRHCHKLYIVGDVKNDRYRQTAICVGDGVMAAMKIHNNVGEAIYEDKGQSRN